MRSPRPLRATLTATAVAASVSALLLSGCASPASEPSAEATPSASAQAQYPRTVTVPPGPANDGHTVSIPAEPTRIAALTFETAETVARLGLADRLVLVPQAVQNPALSNHAEAFADVPALIPVESEVDPETVLAQQPDLVLVSPRRGLDSGVGAVLGEAGVPVVTLSNQWDTVQNVITNVDVIGQAIGADQQSQQLETTLRDGLVPEESLSSAPRVLVLGNQAGVPFVTAGAAYPLELLELAGGHDVSSELGLTKSGPIAAEQIVSAKPDAILLIDMHGRGAESFASVMKNPAVAQLVTDTNVLLVPGRHVQALGLDATIEGRDTIHEWLAALDEQTP